MPHSERRPGGPPHPEDEALPRYHQAARFAGEEPAGATFFAAQEAIYAHAGEIDLSAYRFQLDRVYRVAVLGDPPPTELHDQLRAILTAGEPAQVPEDLLRFFTSRRTDATKLGPWVEGHYRSGNRPR